MSALSDFFTQPGFWWGAPIGALISGTIAPIITARSVRASDKRKIAQENAALGRKEEREDQKRQEETLYQAAEAYTLAVTEVINASVDYKGAFNTVRDFVNNVQGNDDPAAADKLDFAEKMAGAQEKIAVPFNRLKLAAPNDVIDAATKTTVAVMTLVRMTTEPYARQVASSLASDELAGFINVVRKEIGKAEYTSADAKKAAYGFFEVLQRQTDDYVEAAKAEMLAKGFKTTPWDKYVRKTPKIPDTNL